MQLIDVVHDDIPRILATHPDIGCPARLSRTQSEEEKIQLLRRAPLRGSRRLQAREWRAQEF